MRRTRQLHLAGERNRLQREIDDLVESIAAGVPAATVAPKIREREREVASLEAQLRVPRPEAVDRERLRAALEQRTEVWRQELRGEPRVARLLLRRLIEPIVLHEETAEGNELLVEWDAKPIPEGMLDGLYNMLASPRRTEPVPSLWPQAPSRDQVMRSNELAIALRARADALARFAEWALLHPATLTPEAAVAAIGSLYELLPAASRQRRIDTAGVARLHDALRRLSR